MHFASFSLFLFAVLPYVFAKHEWNGPCHHNRKPGFCTTYTACNNQRGLFYSKDCPGMMPYVGCCTGGPPKCPNDKCRWTGRSSGTSCSGPSPESFGVCPGPSDFRCCQKTGTYPKPRIPAGGCKPYVQNAAAKIIAKFPGEIKGIGCYRPGRPQSQHTTGEALDLMVGTYNPIGWEIAEWAMKNRNSLKVMYIMWGQKIWEVGQHREHAWENWAFQEPKERGSLTSNHWDHVHISFSNR